MDLSLSEAARLLGKTDRQVRYLIKEGRIAAQKEVARRGGKGKPEHHYNMPQSLDGFPLAVIEGALTVAFGARRFDKLLPEVRTSEHSNPTLRRQ